MAKTGLDFFRMDTNKYHDIRIKRLKNAHKGTGIAIYDYILCEIYRTKGCYIQWDENTLFDVADYFNESEELVQSIVKYCASIGLFDATILSSKSILTSRSIQERYTEICERAKRKDIIIPEEIRITPEEMAKIPEEMPNTPEVLYIVKESKGKDSKEEDSRECVAKATAYVIPEEVDLSSQVLKTKKFIAPEVDEVVNYFFELESSTNEAERFYDYYLSNGWKVGRNPMKDWKAAARKWIRTEKTYHNGKLTTTTASGDATERIGRISKVALENFINDRSSPGSI